MKRSASILGIGTLIFALSIPSVAQVVELPEIEIVAVNYKYLNAMGEEVAVPVKQVEEAVADFNLKSSEMYEDEYDTY